MMGNVEKTAVQRGVQMPRVLFEGQPGGGLVIYRQDRTDFTDLGIFIQEQPRHPLR